MWRKQQTPQQHWNPSCAYWKVGSTSTGNLVEVDEDGGDSLTSCGDAVSARLGGLVKGIKVRCIELVLLVVCYLWWLKVSNGLASECLDLTRCAVEGEREQEFKTQANHTNGHTFSLSQGSWSLGTK